MEPPRQPYGYEPGYDNGSPQGYSGPSGYGQPSEYGNQAPPSRSRVDAGRLWIGGLVTALVAALTAVVGLLLVRGILGIPVFAPEGDGAMGDASTGLLAGGAALAALAATLLLHLLMLGTPQAGRFLVWIVSLTTVVMVLLPFTFYASLEAQIGTAAVYLAIGVAIGSLLSAVARGAVRGSQGQ
ncbi:hypothetical protein GCM10009837_40420 [Streptomyces durmitorensis]|uniref:DUF6069 family protein n=1 Tax=Streptomyces durmitorensis TaxID=319947 RepID=A0ABY4Q5I9_9ACTN|nr:DUF6069 family protein [Streptomyces durmitorensis]UQT60914.1 DUF6069 family protein [Streptomyces durmitorensis]